MEVRFPGIVVQLTGEDSNAFAVLGTVRRALKEGGVDAETISEFFAEATEGGYDDLLATVMRWVVVE